MKTNQESLATVIIPCRDELQSLVITIPFILTTCRKVGEVLIVADDKEDSSFQLRDFFSPDAHLVSYILNSEGGVFHAIEAGVRNSKYDICLVLPADELLPILNVDEMLSSLNDANRFVTATRHKSGGKRYGGNLLGKSFSNLGNLFLRLRYPSTISDFTTGIKGFYKSDWPLISIGANRRGWSCALAFSINAIKNDLRPVEIPVISVDRFAGGTSSFSLRSWLWSYILIALKP